MTSSPGSCRDLGPLVLSLDVGTGSARALVFSSSRAELVTYHQIPIHSHTPHQGWVEQDADELLSSVEKCVDAVAANLDRLDVDRADVVCAGITNQRETTIVWDRETGKPLHRAIVWLDTRTEGTVQSLLNRLPHHRNSQYYLQRLCGLPLSSYFSALKLRWLLDHVPSVAKALAEGRLLFGTVDSWLIWKLTGGVDGGIHMTDVTNASRTMLMNIETLEWDPFLCNFFGIPMSVLPKIHSSSEIYGRMTMTSLRGVPISGCLGDQQAALVGQGCFRPGQAKNTYGTGCFMLYNVGPGVVFSEHGLLSTVAYKMGKNQPAVYALEGSVAVAGAASRWLHEKLAMIDSVDEIETLATQVEDTGDAYFVPAFSGLFAPHWRSDARGVICGLTQFSSREHLCRASLEAVAFQTREIVAAMEADSGLNLATLLVDGGMSSNSLLMQIQADMLGIPVMRPSMAETTALGAAIAAGCAEGIDVWDVKTFGDEVTTDKFLPRLTEEERDLRFERWKLAVKKSLGWLRDEDLEEEDEDAEEEEEEQEKEEGQIKENQQQRVKMHKPKVSRATKRLYASIPGAVFAFSSFVIWALSEKFP